MKSWKDLNLTDKGMLITSYILRLILLLAIVLEVIKLRWTLFFATTLILFLTFLPSLFERRYRIVLPLEFQFVIIVFIYFSLFLGEMRDYYLRYWWWDVILHTGSGIALGFAGFIILYTLYRKRKITTNPVWAAIFAFFFALGIGALWEIFEFSVDQLIGLNMQKSGLVDTMWDLIVDSIGALITSVIGFFYFKYEKAPLFARMINSYSDQNPKIFRD